MGFFLHPQNIAGTFELSSKYFNPLFKLKSWCFQGHNFNILYFLELYQHHIGGVMVIVLPSSVVGRGFEPRSGQIKDYKIRLSTKEKEQTG